MVHGIGSVPSHSLGIVYPLVLLVVLAAIMLNAPLGARLAHRLQISRLEKIFTLLPAVMGTKLLLGLV